MWSNASTWTDFHNTGVVNMSRADVFLCLQSYIDFEISEGNRENTRKLYERLLQRTRHVKVGVIAVILQHLCRWPAESWLR